MIDLAVGVVIGASFGKIISSLVSNMIMPPLNLLTSKYCVNFSDLAYRVCTEAPKLNPDVAAAARRLSGHYPTVGIQALSKTCGKRGRGRM